MTDPSTRLRRTFAYPSSDSDSEAERGLDAHDQATLITDLSRRDTSSTRIYTLLLLVFPLAPALLHVPLLVDPSSFLTSLLAIASLGASAFALWFLPLPPVKVGVLTVSKEGEVKKRGGSRLSNRDGGGDIGHERPKVPFVSEEEAAEVLAKYAIPVNGGVCALLAVLELFKGRSWGDGVVVGGGYLPGLVFGVVMWARRELRVLDLGELERLRKK